MTDYDVIIVGAGPSGAIIARHLGAAGKKVLLLEAGDNTGKTWHEYQANVDRYRGSAIRVPNAPYEFSKYAPSANVLDVAPIAPAGLGTSGYFVQKGPLPFSSDYARAKGGTTLHWLGTCLRMVPNDFSLASRYGKGIDWPIGYEELSPYYAQAEREFGVSANVEDQQYLGITFSPSYVYPMFRVPPSYGDQVLAGKLNGQLVTIDGSSCTLAVTSTPSARNSIPNPAYDSGRGYEPVGAAGDPHRGHRCEGNSSCIPICPVQAKYSALKTLAAIEGNVTILTQAVVSRVTLAADASTVTGIQYTQYADGEGAVKTCVATAQVYVLAANAIENAKILLASGAADSSGQVGLNLMDHPLLMTWGLMPESVGAFRGPSATSGIEILRDGAFRRERAAFRVEIANWGWDFCAFAPYADVEEAVRVRHLYGAALRESLFNSTPRQIRFGFLVEQLPSADNSVTIDSRWVDPLGNPRPVITYEVDQYTRAGFAAAVEFTKKAFALLGATSETRYNPTEPGYLTYNGAPYAYKGSGHCVGTHRMGLRSSDSVVDSNQRSWDQPNLYVAGCGSMPTIATSNPTLTMGALAFRSVRSILADLGGASA